MCSLTHTTGDRTQRAQAQAATFDGPHTGPLASRTVVSRGDQSLGFAGVEAIGQTNAVVNFAGR